MKMGVCKKWQEAEIVRALQWEHSYHLQKRWSQTAEEPESQRANLISYSKQSTIKSSWAGLRYSETGCFWKLESKSINRLVEIETPVRKGNKEVTLVIILSGKRCNGGSKLKKTFKNH